MENLKTTLLSTISLITSNDKDVTAQDILKDKTLVVYDDFNENTDFFNMIYIKKTDENLSCYILNNDEDGNYRTLNIRDVEISSIFVNPNAKNVYFKDKKSIFSVNDGKKKLILTIDKDKDLNYLLSDASMTYELFANSNYKEISISSTYVNDIPEECFISSYELTSFSSTSPLDFIHDQAFEKCFNLTTVKLSSCLSICNNAFADCISLADVQLPSNLEYIGSNAFIHCIDLSNINLKDTHIKKISQHAFDWCSSLVEIQFPPTLEDIDYYAFVNCDSLSVFSFKGFTKVIDISKINPIISYNIVVPDNLVDEWKASSEHHSPYIISETEFQKQNH